MLRPWAEAAALADSDPDNLEYQRRSEETAAAAIEALEAKSDAEAAMAATALQLSLTASARPHTKYFFSLTSAFILEHL